MADKEQTQEDEEISKETLISLLKDKSKEIKTLTTKLQKLEEKYVKNYKEVKLYKKDYESLTKFLKQNVFDKDPFLLPAFSMGDYEYDKLHELWIKRDQHQNKTLTNLLQELNQEKQEAQQKYDKMLEEAQKNAKSANQNSNLSETIKKYENQLYDLNEQNQKLADEIVESNQLIQQKSDVISQLRKVEEQYQQHKAEMLLKEMQSNSQLANNSNTLDKKIANSQKINDFLKVKNELENALDKNRQLENKIDEMKLEVNRLNTQIQTQHTMNKKEELAAVNKPKLQSIEVQTDNYGVSPYPQKNVPHESNSNIESKPNSLSQISDKNMTVSQSPQNNNGSFSEVTQEYFPQNGDQKETINHEYLKNVILKYFIYQEGKHYNEASLLMTAIMTILKMSKEDREKVNLARQNATLWNSTKHFISNTFAFGGAQSEFDYTKK